MSKPGTAWRAHMAGVGGMGIGVVNAILVRAGHKEGYRVVFPDKKGLAIRNGGVYSQITFVKDDEEKPEAGSQEPAGQTAYPTTGSIPYGRADLLLGIDILEAARAIDPREQFRVAVAGPHRDGAQPLPPADGLHAARQAGLRPREAPRRDLRPRQPEHSFAKNLSELCEQRLGSKLYANIMMLGVAFQLGLHPGVARGASPGRSRTRSAATTARTSRRSTSAASSPSSPARCRTSRRRRRGSSSSRTRAASSAASGCSGATAAMAFEKLVQGAMKQMRDLPERAKYDLALRIYDLMQYQDADFAKRVHRARPQRLPPRRAPSRKFAATIAAIWNLAKVMLIKDEVYVSYLLTRFEKKQRDIAKYGVDVSNGDRIVYRHHTSPEFNVGKYRVRLRITTRDWHLKLVQPHEVVAQAPRLAPARDRVPRLVRRPARPRQPRQRRRLRAGRPRAAVPGGSHRLPRGPLPQAGPRDASRSRPSCPASRRSSKST